MRYDIALLRVILESCDLITVRTEHVAVQHPDVIVAEWQAAELAFCPRIDGPAAA
jgi:hypothetical protein